MTISGRVSSSYFDQENKVVTQILGCLVDLGYGSNIEIFLVEDANHEAALSAEWLQFKQNITNTAGGEEGNTVDKQQDNNPRQFISAVANGGSRIFRVFTDFLPPFTSRNNSISALQTEIEDLCATQLDTLGTHNVSSFLSAEDFSDDELILLKRARAAVFNDFTELFISRCQGQTAAHFSSLMLKNICIALQSTKRSPEILNAFVDVYRLEFLLEILVRKMLTESPEEVRIYYESDCMSWIASLLKSLSQNVKIITPEEKQHHLVGLTWTLCLSLLAQFGEEDAIIRTHLGSSLLSLIQVGHTPNDLQWSELADSVSDIYARAHLSRSLS